MSLTDNNFQTIKFINSSGVIESKVKQIYSVNKNGLLNRWVPPSVTLNDDTHVLDEVNCTSHYSMCLQKDIIKPNNCMEEYQNIQISLVNKENSFFNSSMFAMNKAFNVVDYWSNNMYECRKLCACYNNSQNKDIDDIKWRVCIDHLKLNVIMSTFLIKKLISSNYSSYLTQIILIQPKHKSIKSKPDTNEVTPTSKLF